MYEEAQGKVLCIFTSIWVWWRNFDRGGILLDEARDNGNVGSNSLSEQSGFVDYIFASVVKDADNEFRVLDLEPGKENLVI